MPQKDDLPSVKEEKSDQKPKQTKKNDALARFIENRMTDMKAYRSEFDVNWDVYDRLYLSYPASEPPEDWQANIFVPMTMSTILAILAEITARRTRWRLLPTAPDDEPKVDTLSAITEYTLDKGNWDHESFKRDLDKLIYGTSVWKEIYREDRRVIRKRTFVKEGGERKEKIITEDVREFNDVYGKHIPLRQFYLDDQATEIRNARDCIERTISNISDFKTRYSKYRNANKVKEWGFIKPSISEQQIQNIPAGGDTNVEGDYTPMSQLKDNQVEVIEYWSKPDDRHVIMANGIIVVDEPIPYDHKQLPYAMDVAIPRPNCAYGIGIPQLLEGTNEELNTLHNMMIDTGKLDINTPHVVGGMTVLDEDEMTVRPGGVIAVDDVAQWKQVQQKGLVQSHFALVEEVKQIARIASGLDVRFAENSAPSGGGDDTATEVIRLQEASLRRIGLLNKILELHCLHRIGWLRTANIQQFYKDPLKVEMLMDDEGNIVLDELTGKPKYKKSTRRIRFQKEGEASYSFQEITPEQIRANVDVQVVPQSTQPMSQAVLIKRLTTAIQTVLASPQALEVTDITELFKQWYKQLDLPMSIVRKTLKGNESGVELAQEETINMAHGAKIPSTPNPSMKHTAVHIAFVYEMMQGRPSGQLTQHFMELDQAKQKKILDHIDGEEKQHAAKGNIEYPQQRTMGVNTGMGTQENKAGQEVEAPAVWGGVVNGGQTPTDR